MNYSALENILTQALNSVSQSLSSFSHSPSYQQDMLLVFGDRLTSVIAQSYQQLWDNPDFDLSDKIEIRRQAELGGANGSFSRDTGMIYLAEEYLQHNSVEAIALLILEEYGHLIDAEVNPVETLGDEGAIFARLVRGENITAEELQALQTEDDTANLVLDGKNIKIELDGQLIALTSAEYQYNENGAPTIAVRIIRTGMVEGEVGATLNLSDRLATSGKDFDANPISITFEEGEISKYIPIPIIDDLEFENDEYFEITLTNPSGGAILGDITTARVTIKDNDTNKGITLNDANPIIIDNSRLNSVNIGASEFALSFDGNDYVNVGNTTDLVLTDNFTLEAKIYPTSSSGTSNVILGKEGEYLISRFNDGTIGFAFANSNPGWRWFNTGYVVTYDEWTHLTVTYETGVLKLYDDGILVYTYNGSGTIGDALTNQDDFQIGSRQYNNESFIGLIDEVRVWDVVRSEAEILASYQQKLTGIETGLVGYWNFDDGVPEDLTSNNNDGTVIGAIFKPETVSKTPEEIVYTLTEIPERGELTLLDDLALSFDGVNDYMEIPHDDSLSLTTFTIETWINLNQVKSDWQPIITKENDSGRERNYGIYIRPNERRIHFSFSDVNGGWHSYDSQTSLTLNEWSHIAMTYDGSNFNLYIDGQLDRSVNISYDVLQNTYPVKIGKEINPSNSSNTLSSFAGQLDDIRIWNVARSEAEIQANYQQKLTGTETGLVGYWNFNNIDGNIANDLSSNDNNGRIFGATSFGNSMLSTNTLLAIDDTFTQADIDNERLIYTPDFATGIQDDFKFTVTDGETTTPEQTFFVIEPIYFNDFETIVGAEWSSNKTETSPIGDRKFLGQFGNGTVSLTLNDDRLIDKVVTLEFDLFVLRSWDGSGPYGGPDVFKVALEGGETLFESPVTRGSIEEYPDLESTETNTLGFVWNGSISDSVYHITTTFYNPSDTLTLNFAGKGLQGLGDESWGIDNVSLSTQPNTNNDAPTAINLDNTTVDEGSTEGTAIATVTTIDPDPNDEHTYSLLDDAEGRFSLDGDKLTVADTNLLTPGNYNVTIQTEDLLGLNYQETVTITVNEVNYPPTAIQLSNTNIDENIPNDTVVGFLTTTDPDSDDTHTYTLLDSAGERFRLEGNQIIVNNTSLLDYETDTSHSITVRSTDNQGLSLEKNFTITINNLAPDLVVSNISVGNNQVVAGNNLNLTWTITNQGQEDTESNWIDYVYLSKDNNINTTSDNLRYEYQHQDNLAKFASVDQQATIPIPANFNGDYNLIIVTDANNEVSEGNGENNNAQFYQQKITVTNPQPNLQVTNINAPNELFLGQQTEIEWTVANVGDGATANQTWSERVWLSLDNQIESNEDISLGTVSNLNNLISNDSYNNRLIVTIPENITQASYYLIIQTDNSNTVTESVETDNITFKLVR